MKAGESFDESFLASLSPHRRMIFEAAVELGELSDTESIRDSLFRFIFEITPGTRAAVFIDNSLWERDRDNPESRLGTHNDTIDTVFKRGEPALLNDSDRSMLCLPLVSRSYVLGAVYIESLDANKPLDQVHRFFLTGVAPIVANAFAHSMHIERLQAENSRLHEALDSSRDLVGGGPAVKRIKEQIRKIAPKDVTVLIEGESGTGKEMAAQAIHQSSNRKHAIFVPVNCGAIAESLRESELFGHEKGAFTGATAQRKGKIEMANGGTLFLDEVAELSPSAQAMLLRVLQERKFERLGGTRTIEVDVRIVAATNSDLKKAVKEGRFRQDLFFRLNVVSLKMPALRERTEDILSLASHFIQKHSAVRRVSGIAPEAEALLISYDWPGNVRELENTIMRALVMGAGDIIRPEDLPETLTERKQAKSAGTYHDRLNAAKRSIVEDGLRRAGGNEVEAARMLDVHFTYLYRLIRNLNID